MSFKIIKIWKDLGFGVTSHFLLTESHSIESVFAVHKVTSADQPYPFKIERLRKTHQMVFRARHIEEEVLETFLFITDDEYRKKFSRSYHLIKFVMSSEIVTVGAYADSKTPLDYGNAYIICTNDFINLLAPSTKVESAEQLDGTGFEAFQCLYDKNEMAKALLRE